MAPKPTPNASETTEHRATVRIDESPGGKRFQGVWLEFPGATKWVIDYRAREFWKPFEGQEVIVTGRCWRPEGQAINATHFHVDRMRFVTPRRGHGPILEIWPELELRGRFHAEQAPAGSKAAGSSTTRFIDDGGKTYSLQGASVKLPALEENVWIRARGITPDLSFTATSADASATLWILDVRDHEFVEERSDADCP